MYISLAIHVLVESTPDDDSQIWKQSFHANVGHSRHLNSFFLFRTGPKNWTILNRQQFSNASSFVMLLHLPCNCQIGIYNFIIHFLIDGKGRAVPVCKPPLLQGLPHRETLPSNYSNNYSKIQRCVVCCCKVNNKTYSVSIFIQTSLANPSHILWLCIRRPNLPTVPMVIKY